ncbi:MAG: VWA domain-containing protein, partial [Thermoanaerobaculia bacterium]
MIRGTGRNLSLLLLLMLGIAWPGLAQEPVQAPEGAEDEGTYVETVDVTVVNLDVYVTDKKGEPITGLARDDFEIFENGRPVAISNFFAVEDRQPVEAQPPAAVAEPEAPAIPGMPEEQQFALPDDQRLSLVIYVDNFNIRPFNRNRVFRRLRDFLIEKISTHDQVMLVTYDRSLHMRHDFTSDPTLIASQLFELEELAAFGVHWDSERRDVLRDIND